MNILALRLPVLSIFLFYMMSFVYSSTAITTLIIYLVLLETLLSHSHLIKVTPHDSKMSQLATKISADGFVSKKNREELAKLMNIRGITCHGIHFHQTIRHKNCKPVIISNKMCFGSCLSKAKPLLFVGKIIQSKSPVPTCRPKHVISKQVMLNCHENTQHSKEVNVTRACSCS